MKENDPDLLVAICNAARQRCRQRDTEEGRGQLTIGKVLGSESFAKTETLSCLQLPHIHTG